MQNHARIAGVAAGIRGDKTSEMTVQRLNNLLVHPLISRGRGELFTRDKFAQIDGVLLGQQHDHVFAGTQNQLAHGRTVGMRLGE
ncbi:hypothetical protein SDC9_191565 [bioreactor metagenome]|uniref:Uncharacterized protein n=1 Tax=bioreactor metagenome TaxID=1076179 RepID=A0A645I6I1_9ZZZZ